MPHATEGGRSYWDRHARRYDAFMRLLAQPMGRALTLVEEEARGCNLVLEVAAGTGLFTVAIARAAAHVIATDCSVAMVRELDARLARDRVRNVVSGRADLYALPYDPGTFDAVVAANVLHLIADLAGALAALRRVLRPGGKIVAPTFVHGETGTSRALSRVASWTGFPCARRLTTAQLAASIVSARFVVHRSETIGGIVPIGFVAATAAD